MRRIIDALLSFIYPDDEDSVALKRVAPSELVTIIPRVTDYSGMVTSGIHALWQYDDPVAKALIYKIKNTRDSHAIRCAGLALYLFLSKELAPAESIVLVPIPLSRKRLRERGYNQCELIARACESIALEQTCPCSITVVIDLLARTKHRGEQKEKSRGDRITSSQGIFSIKKIPGTTTNTAYIIVDDVTTTGSTLDEARQVLTSAGLKTILPIAIAH